MLGIDVGGNKVLCVRLSKGKTVIKRKVEIKKKEKERFLETIEKFIQESREEKVGIGFPGLLTRRKIVFSPNLPFFNGFKIVDYLERKYGVEVLLENDANCFALGEYIRWRRDLVGITLGTGLGCGIIIDGKLYKGMGNAGELGHTIIKFDGRKCRCGNIGCVEEYLSERAFLRESKRVMGKSYTPFELSEMCKKGDRRALRIFEEMGRILGILITNITHFLHPEMIVIGGGISKAWKYMKRSCLEEMKRRCMVKLPKIVRGKEESGAIGAAYLFRYLKH